MAPHVTLTGDNLIGDTLLQTPALRALKQEHPNLTVEYRHGLTLHSSDILSDNPYLDCLKLEHEDEPLLPGPVIRMDAAAAFAWGKENGRTIAEGFGALVGVDVSDIRYDYTITEEETTAMKPVVMNLGDGKPVVFIARHSASCSSNDDRCGRVANKCIANRHWVQVADWLLKEGFMPVALGGGLDEKNDPRYREWPGEKFYGWPLRKVAAMLPLGAAVLSVDTGIRHLAAATGANLYCLSGAIPLDLIRCVPTRETQKILEEHVPLQYASAARIIKGAKQILS